MIIEADTIKKYKKLTIPQLRHKAGLRFRAWIRKRDEGMQCISCGSYNTTDASHYYSAGHYPELEFHPMNVHASCKKCNTFLHGNLIEYRKGLINRIGEKNIIILDNIVGMFRRTPWKHDRFYLIGIIEKYK
jgi:hypothetical protein